MRHSTSLKVADRGRKQQIDDVTITGMFLTVTLSFAL